MAKRASLNPEELQHALAVVLRIFKAGWASPSGGRDRIERYDAVHAYQERKIWFDEVHRLKGDGMVLPPLTIREMRTLWAEAKADPRAVIDRDGVLAKQKFEHSRGLTKAARVNFTEFSYDRAKLNEASVAYLAKYYPEVFGHMDIEGISE